MNIQNFTVVLASYIEQYIFPNFNSPTLKWIGGGIIPIAGTIVQTYLVNNAETLKTMGIIQSDGNVNIDLIETFFTGAFAHQPTLTVNPKNLLNTKFEIPFLNNLLDVDLTFNANDAGQLISMLRSQR